MRLRPDRDLLPVLVVFLATRALLLWLAIDTGLHHAIDSSLGDVGIYEGWARTLLREDLAAYRGVGIEYPPGSLPFFTLPLLTDGVVGYRAGFAVLMAAVDAAGLAALARLGRRGGSLRGAWLWTLGVPLVGPFVYARFDLVPAVTTIWAVAAATTGHWFSTGAWLGLGAAAKVYPGLLVPAAALLAGRQRLTLRRGGRDPARLAVLGGAALVCLAAVLPFVGDLGSVAASVLGYHADRGIQLESVPANILLVAARVGWAPGLVGGFDHGAYHLSGAWSDGLAAASTVLAVAALVGTTALVARWAQRGTWLGMAEGMFVVLLWTMVTGKVLSPQFLLWPLALGAACLASTDTRMTWPAWAVLPAAALTQAIFPWLYRGLQRGAWPAVGILTLRNVLLAGAAVAGALMVRRSPVMNGGNDAYEPPAAETVPHDRTPATGARRQGSP